MCCRNITQRSEDVVWTIKHNNVCLQLDNRYAPSTEVRSKIKFLEELDKLEHKQHQEAEKEVLLRAVKVSTVGLLLVQGNNLNFQNF